jgi:hypothetical protein
VSGGVAEKGHDAAVYLHRTHLFPIALAEPQRAVLTECLLHQGHPDHVLVRACRLPDTVLQDHASLADHAIVIQVSRKQVFAALAYLVVGDEGGQAPLCDLEAPPEARDLDSGLLDVALWALCGFDDLQGPTPGFGDLDDTGVGTRYVEALLAHLALIHETVGVGEVDAALDVVLLAEPFHVDLRPKLVHLGVGAPLAL